jgi:hypothetical protein
MKLTIKRIFMNHIIAINLLPSFNFHVNLFSPSTKICSANTVMVFITIFHWTFSAHWSVCILLSMLNGVEDSSLRTAKTLDRKFETNIPKNSFIPNSFIHVSVSDLYIPTIGQIHECGNW